MNAPITNQTRLNRFFADNVTADPGAPAIIANDLPAWMRNRAGYKGIDQIVAWGTNAANETAVVSMYYAWDLTDPAIDKGETGDRAYLIQEAIEFTWTFGTLKGIIGMPIGINDFFADTVTAVKKTAQDYIELLTGDALVLDSPADDVIAYAGVPNLGNVAAYGFRRTGGTSTSNNLAVQLGNGRT